jgi:hypothetical protein
MKGKGSNFFLGGGGVEDVNHGDAWYASWHETSSDNKINVKGLDTSSVPNFFGCVTLYK